MSNDLKPSRDAAIEIAEILGCQSDHISSIKIDLEARSIVRVNVEFVMTKEQWAQIGKAKE